jgi:hypothetical protein
MTSKAGVLNTSGFILFGNSLTEFYFSTGEGLYNFRIRDAFKKK